MITTDGKRILALDPSLKGTGYAYDSNEGLKYGVWHFKPKTDFAANLVDIEKNLRDIIAENDINYVIKEGIAFGYNNNGKNKIIMVNGIIHKVCYEAALSTVDVVPTSLKKMVTGIGKGNKERVKKAVQSWGYMETDDNITDAIAIHMVGRHYLDVIMDDGEEWGKVKISNYSNEIMERISSGVFGML